jgi:UDP-N-acetylmuramate--alanine ligase
MTTPRYLPGQDVMLAMRRVHFIGIGGVGMSGIAEVLLTLGYAVSGSDLGPSAATARLIAAGARVHYGHAAANIDGADVVVVSSAISPDNPELLAARQQRLVVVPRAEMLGELMRFRRGIAIAGTHGKTTTTSLAASVLAEGGLDPTFVIGGKLEATGSNAKLGRGDWLVAEADESDGSFLMLMPVIAVITNIDADHLENYDGNFARLRQAFADFLHRLPFYGLAVLCHEDAHCRALAESATRAVLTYGYTAQADIHAARLRQQRERMSFDLHLPGQPALPVSLALPGRHNVLNACAAAAVAWQIGVAPEAIAAGLERFQGVGRRFTLRGSLATRDGGEALLVDDYGHHPREIAVVMAAARGGWPERRLVLVFQPHRYSRTRALLEDFAEVLASADVLVLTEVYAAGEAPLPNADGRALARAVRARGRVEPVFVEHGSDLPEALGALLRDGDLLVLLGAGDIGQLPARLQSEGLGLKA